MIQAQSADGVIHEFPDNTPQEVIDRVMKSHVDAESKPEKTETKLPPSEPSFSEDVLRGFTAPVAGAVQLFQKATGIGSATAQPSGEGVTKAKKVPSDKSDQITPGYILGGMIGPAGAAGAAAKVAPRIITPMTKAIIAGGVGGAVQPVEEGKDYWQEKERQIGEGMVLGYGFSVAGKAVSKGLDALGNFLARKYPENVLNQAVTTVLKRIEQDNKYGAPNAKDALDLVEAANEKGKPLALIDVGGRNLYSLGGRVARSPGESGALAEGVLRKRDVGAPDRLSADIDKYVFSGPTMHDTAEALLRGRSEAARPLYEETDKLQGIWSPRLQQFLDNPDVAKGMARGYHIEQLKSLAENRDFNPTQMGVDLDAQGNIHLLRKPSMRVLDMGKQGLDAMVAEQRDPITGRLSSLGVALDQVRRSYLNELDSLDKNGVYRKAREAWAGPSASLDALRAGRSVFLNSPEENAALVKALSPSNREFALIGMADMLRERLLKSGLNSDESKALVRSEWMKRQMKPFFRTENDFNGFIDAVTKEQVMAASKARVLGGSQTAERLGEDQSDQAAKIASLARIARGFAEGRLFSVVGEMWRMRRDATSRPDPQLDEAIAKLLFSPDISKTELGQRLLKPPGITGNYLARPARTMQDVVAPAAAAGGAEAVR